ncbi:MAG: TPM domain-containing protein [Hylemonella sp.]|jgi:uncharacterized membrane protein
MLQRIKRLFRHRWVDQASLRRALPAAAMARLQQLVQASEQRHSAEICIYVEAGLPISYLMRPSSTREITRQRATTLFGKLRVWDTEHNNGVLLYLLLSERSIEIVADRGIDRLVAPEQWQQILANMGEPLRSGRFEAGLSQAVTQITALLAQYFPLAEGQPNPNELPDAPVLGQR